MHPFYCICIKVYMYEAGNPFALVRRHKPNGMPQQSWSLHSSPLQDILGNDRPTGRKAQKCLIGLAATVDSAPAAILASTAKIAIGLKQGKAILAEMGGRVGQSLCLSSA